MTNKSPRPLVSVVLLGSVVGALFSGCASQPERTPPRVVDDRTTNYIESARGQLRERKVQALSEAMQLDPSEHDAFWNQYYQYEKELKAVNDDKVRLVRDYANSFDRMDDQIADDLATRGLRITERALDLRKKYYRRIKSATSAATAARFLQVEQQINLLLDLDLATQLPLLTKQR